MYRGRYDKPTPPGYSGIAFAPREEVEEKRVKNPPTPVENGAGDEYAKQKTQVLDQARQGAPLADRRNEIKTPPRNFAGASQPCGSEETERSGEGLDWLSSLFRQKVSLEELLLLASALLLATKEEKSESFAVFALALMLLEC